MDSYISTYRVSSMLSRICFVIILALSTYCNTLMADVTKERLGNLFKDDFVVTDVEGGMSRDEVIAIITSNDTAVVVPREIDVSHKAARAMRPTRVCPYLWFVTSDGEDFAQATNRMSEVYPDYKPYGCSGVCNSRFHGRNLDWYYDRKASVVVRSPAKEDKHGVLGIVGGTIDDSVLDTGKWTGTYAALTFSLGDGINDAGVTVQQNVIPYDPERSAAWRTNSIGRIISFCIVRYVLDRCGTAREAADMICNKVYVPNDFKYDCHYMVSDSTSSFIVEDGHVYDVSKVPTDAITNFRVGTASYNDDSTVKWDTVEAYGNGVERYDLMRTSGYNLRTLAGITQMMKDLWYTKAYETNTVPYWYTEHCSPDFPYLTVMAAKTNQALFARQQRAWKRDLDREHNKTSEYYRAGSTWQTVHTAVYDRNALTVRVITQEDPASERVFSLLTDMPKSDEASGSYVKYEEDRTGTNTAVTIGSRDTYSDTGISSLVNGNECAALGDYAHAEGHSTSVYGDSSHSEGVESSVISGVGGHAEGYMTSVGNNSSSVTAGNYAHAEGESTVAQGIASHAEGRGTRTGKPSMQWADSGAYSHAEGDYTVAEGDYAHSEGRLSFAFGAGSHAEGSNTTTRTPYTHAEGITSSVISGFGGHAEGYNTQVGEDYNLYSGSYAHAEGQETKAKGLAAHAEGLHSIASGDYSHADGSYANATNSHSYVWGGTTNSTYSNGEGTFNIYPKGGADGFYIGGTNLTTLIGQGGGGGGGGLVNDVKTNGVSIVANKVADIYNPVRAIASSASVTNAGAVADAEAKYLPLTGGTVNRNTFLLKDEANHEVLEYATTYNQWYLNGIANIALNCDKLQSAGGAIQFNYDTFRWVMSDGRGQGTHYAIANTNDIPTKTSELTNDSGFIATSEHEWQSTVSGNCFTNRSIYVENSMDTNIYHKAYGTNTFSSFFVHLPSGSTIDPGHDTGDEGGIALVRLDTDEVMTGQINTSISNTHYGAFHIIDPQAATEIRSDKLIVDRYTDQTEVKYPIDSGTFAIEENTVQKIADSASGNKTAVTIGTRNSSPVGRYSLVNGAMCYGDGDCAHAEGFLTRATNAQAHAEGSLSVAGGKYSHAEGCNARAYGMGAHAEGLQTEAHGIYSHTEGMATKAYGNYSHAEGASTCTYGKYSKASGSNAIATNDLTFVWSGKEESYTDNGIGTFNINPVGGASGFWIGGTDLNTLIEQGGGGGGSVSVANVKNVDGNPIYDEEVGLSYLLGWSDVTYGHPQFEVRCEGNITLTTAESPRSSRLDSIVIDKTGITVFKDGSIVVNKSWDGLLTKYDTLDTIKTNSVYPVKSIAVYAAITNSIADLETKTDASSKLTESKAYADSVASAAKIAAVEESKEYTDSAMLDRTAFKLYTTDKSAYQDANGGYYEYKIDKNWYIFDDDGHTSTLYQVSTTNWHGNPVEKLPYTKLIYSSTDGVYEFYLSSDDETWRYAGDAEGSLESTSLSFDGLDLAGASFETGAYKKTKQVAYESATASTSAHASSYSCAGRNFMWYNTSVNEFTVSLTLSNGSVIPALQNKMYSDVISVTINGSYSIDCITFNGIRTPNTISGGTYAGIVDGYIVQIPYDMKAVTSPAAPHATPYTFSLSTDTVIGIGITEK